MKTTRSDLKIRSCRGSEADAPDFSSNYASSRRQLRSGFSLLEVMVAILILGIAIVGFTEGITTALRSGKESELQTTASLFAAGQIEQLRAEGDLMDGETEGDCGDDLPLYHWKQSVTAADVDGLHEVAVAVEDTRSGKVVYELRTLLFERPEDSDSSQRKSRNRSSSSGGGQTR